MKILILASLLIPFIGFMSCGPDNDDQPKDDDHTVQYDTLFVNDTFKSYWFQDIGQQKVFRRTDRMDTLLLDTAIVITKWDTLVFDYVTETIREDCGIEIQHTYTGYNNSVNQFLWSTMSLRELVSEGFYAGTLLVWPPRSDVNRQINKIDEFILNKDTFLNTYHCERGTFEVWLAKDIGVVKVILANGHIWELSNLKS